MIFQLSHANENSDDVGYTIKHAFIEASSLLHAHIFVTLFGYRISPEYYEDTDTVDEPDHRQIENMLETYTLDRFESANEECSQGEHFWHALKIAPNHGLPIQLGGELPFKVTIQCNLPCLHQLNKDPSLFNMYRTEMDSNIYQFQAPESMSILQYLRQNSGAFSLNGFFEELPDEIDWQKVETLVENRRTCMDANHVHGFLIGIRCEQLQSSLPLISSNM